MKDKGLDFFDYLQLMFIYLKLVGKIDWSWIWVLMPLIAGVVLTLATSTGRSEER